MFNIPEPHCVCVFLALSLARSLPLTLLPASSAVFLFMCVCVVSGNGPYRAAALSLFTEGSSLPPLRQGRQEVGVYIGLLYPKKAAWAEGAAELKCCFCRRRCCALPRPAPCPIPPSAVPPMAAVLAKFSGWSWVARNYRVAFGAAAVRAHGLGDRKELSASHKQDSSCAHDTRDLERTLPGKSLQTPTSTADCGSVWRLSMTCSRWTAKQTLNYA